MATGYRNTGLVWIGLGLVFFLTGNETSWPLYLVGALDLYLGIKKKGTIPKLDKKIDAARDYFGIDVDSIPDYDSNDVTGWWN